MELGSVPSKKDTKPTWFKKYICSSTRFSHMGLDSLPNFKRLEAFSFSFWVF